MQRIEPPPGYEHKQRIRFKRSERVEIGSDKSGPFVDVWVPVDQPGEIGDTITSGMGASLPSESLSKPVIGNRPHT